MGQAVVALRVVQAARDEARQDAPVFPARFEKAEREGFSVGAIVRRADGLEQLREAVRNRPVAGDGAITAASRRQPLRRRGEDKLEGHQRAGDSDEGNIAGEARCISQ